MDGEIFDDRGRSLSSTHRDPPDSTTRWITRIITLEFSDYKIPLTILSATDVTKTGSLKVTVDNDQFLSSFFERALIIFISGFVRNVFLALLLTITFFFILAKPIILLAEQLQEIDPLEPGDKQLKISENHADDELGQLVRTGNKFIETGKFLSAELRKSHDELETRVKERTADLSRSEAKLKEAQSIAGNCIRAM